MLENISAIIAVIFLLAIGSMIRNIIKNRAPHHRHNVFLKPVETPVVVSAEDVAGRSEPVFSEEEVKLVDKPLTVSIVPQKPVSRPTRTPLDSSLLCVSVMASPGSLFSSYELLQAITNAGFHYGAMGIFHRHEDWEGKSKILFSMASAVKPGRFDLQNIGAFSTPGLTLFMDAAMHNNPNRVLQLFLDTAAQLAEELSGVLFERPNQPWSEESYEKYEAVVNAVFQQREKEAKEKSLLSVNAQ